MNEVTCYIALGSNLQNPKLQVATAIEEISVIPGVWLKNRSSLYNTNPVGYAEQPNFINAVVEVVTILTAHDLLAQLMQIEHKHGRIRTAEKNGPRVLDLDLLLYGQQKMNTEALIVPHPRMWEREFVMLPLLEIAPQFKRFSAVGENITLESC